MANAIPVDELTLQVTDPTKHDDHIKFRIILRGMSRVCGFLRF